MLIIHLTWISHKHLKFSISPKQIYHQISITIIAHVHLQKAVALFALSILVNEITIYSATQARNYKVRFDFTFSKRFLTNYISNQSKNFDSSTSEKNVSF